MKSILTLIILLVYTGSFIQTAPDIKWQKCLGSFDNDVANCIQQTTDGGYIMSGTSRANSGDVSGNHGTDDYWVVKLRKNGTIQWQKSLGGSSYDYARFIQQTKDGGYIVAGSSQSTNGDVTGNHGSHDYWIIKLKMNGNIQWKKCLGGSSGDYANSIQQTNDSGYIVAGSSGSTDGDVTGNHGKGDYWIVKLTKNGSIQWQKSFGGSNGESASCIQQTKDGGYIISGETYSNDGDVSGNHSISADYWIVKINGNGVMQWQKCLGGTGIDWAATSIKQTNDGGYIVAGRSNSNDGDITGNHGNYDFWVVKLKHNGAIQWQKSLGGNSEDNAYSIYQTADSGYVVAGTSSSINNGDVQGGYGHGDAWIVKLKKSGNIEWQKCLGGTSADGAGSVSQTNDNGYIIAGYTFSNDSDVSGNHGFYEDCWIVKLNAENSSVAKSNSFADINTIKIKGSIKDFILYPNPAKDRLFIQTTGSASFSLIKSSGEILFTRALTGTGHIDVSAVPPGVYYLKNNTTGVVKEVLVKR